MTLEERFEALMQNYEEERHQNENLRKQFGQSMRAQRRNLQGTPSYIPSESNQENKEEVSNPFLPQVKKTVLRQGGAIELLTIFKTLKWRFQSLKAGWTPMNS